MKVRVEGIHAREYTDTKTGQLTTAIELHCVRLNTPSDPGLVGNVVLTVNATRYPKAKLLTVSKEYNMDIEVYVGKNGRFARLVSVEELDNT